MQPIDLETAHELLDFSGGDAALESLGQLQLTGAVALHNMLADPDIGVGYLADEVGMGKTYIALGVVTLMRYFNPGYRVLYICPGRNVQEKWYGREYPSFIHANVRKSHYRMRTPAGTAAAPAVFCHNVNELFDATTTGYYGDIFVRMSSFSMPMADDRESLGRHLQRLNRQVPPGVLNQPVSCSKEAVKEAYARALNYLLPTFDLVVIDEAHNFKHSLDSSARNQALSRILGFRTDEEDGYRQRAKAALMLSATPFDLDPAHLANQLALVGKAHLMPEKNSWNDRKCLTAAMQTFMVRRLNTLNIKGERHTRNMYRREWRKNDGRVEIGFETAEHKLITALVQKHIGDMLNRKGENSAFQMGLLASFESYAETANAGRVEFDGEQTSDTSDAEDRQLIAMLRDSYVNEEKLGQSLPHPKMDQVSRQAAEQMLIHGRKQLVFVRRVKSVKELKHKLDDQYDDWLHSYIKTTLVNHTNAWEFMQHAFAIYRVQRKREDSDIAGTEATGEPALEEHQTPQNDTFFRWFFRGKMAPELTQKLGTHYDGWPIPEVLNQSLNDKSNANVLLLEFNWASWVAAEWFGSTLPKLMARLGQPAIDNALAAIDGVPSNDNISLFLAIQRAFLLETSRHYPDRPALQILADEHLKPMIRQGEVKPKGQRRLQAMLMARTLFTDLYQSELMSAVFGPAAEELKAPDISQKRASEIIHRLEMYRQLAAHVLRHGHPFIDVYLARLCLGRAELNAARRQEWLDQLCRMLHDQLACSDFNSAKELKCLGDNLDLIIKNNLPGVFACPPSELRAWINSQLPSSAPVIGASGETSAHRSIQARNFRMPGYPLALVSTNVFQEGEDLHTFCDSVIHYGLPASAVSVEQKTGRVDRVGALAHRRLLSMDANSHHITEDDYIQVSFPFVKQSIEAIQVRALCLRMNAFIGSLHEIGGNEGSMEQFLDLSQELADRSEIPDQLLTPLESPYIPTVTYRASPVLKNSIKTNQRRYQTAERHIAALVQRIARIEPNHRRAIDGEILGIPRHSWYISLEAARANAEMLIRVRTAHDAPTLESLYAVITTEAMLSRQAHDYTNTRYRTQAEWTHNGLAFGLDAAMLAGGPRVTKKADIVGLFQRFSMEEHGDKAGLLKLKSMLHGLNRSSLAACLEQRYHWRGVMTTRKRTASLDISFTFTSEETRRKRRVSVSYRCGYAYFETMIADESTVAALTYEQLRQYTWLRNRNVDLVDFIVRPDECLIARAWHPASNLKIEALAFTAFTLAREADRLIHLIE